MCIRSWAERLVTERTRPPTTIGRSSTKFSTDLRNSRVAVAPREREGAAADPNPQAEAALSGAAPALEAGKTTAAASCQTWPVWSRPGSWRAGWPQPFRPGWLRRALLALQPGQQNP